MGEPLLPRRRRRPDLPLGFRKVDSNNLRGMSGASERIRIVDLRIPSEVPPPAGNAESQNPQNIEAPETSENQQDP